MWRLGIIALTAFFLLPLRAAADPLCVGVRINEKGTANADITVDATAAGVTVLDANSSRCAAIISNVGTANMRCAPTTVTVTTTAGYLIVAGRDLVLGVESRQSWKCIRTTASSTTASVVETP